MKFDYVHIILMLLVVGLLGYIFYPKPDTSDIINEKDKIINQKTEEIIRYRDSLLNQKEISDSLLILSQQKDSTLNVKLKELENVKKQLQNNVNVVNGFNTIESIEFFSNWIGTTGK